MKSKKVYALYLAVAFFFSLFSFGNNVYADVVYNQPDSDQILQTTSSWCFVALSNPPCLATFTLSTNTVFEYGVAHLKIDGLRYSGSGNSTIVINISNSGVSQFVNFSSTQMPLTTSFDDYIFTAYAGDDGGTETMLPAGTYYVWINQSDPVYYYYANTADSYFAGYISADGSTPPPPDTSSRIDTFTFSTSTRIANITGYWNTHATSSETLSFWQQSNSLGQESFISFTATTTGAFNFSVEFLGLPTPYTGSTTTAPIIAPYDLIASLDLIDPSYYDPFGQQGLDTSLYSTNLDYESITVSTLTYGLPDLSTGQGLYGYPEYECAITSITGCLKNAGIWLFYPSADSITQFKSLGTTLQGKYPFSYAYGVNQMRQELFGASSTPQTISLNFKIIPGHGTSTLELLSQDKLSAVPYAGTVKTILGWILWLLAIEYIYYRVIRSHDPNTPA